MINPHHVPAIVNLHGCRARHHLLASTQGAPKGLFRSHTTTYTDIRGPHRDRDTRGRRRPRAGARSIGDGDGEAQPAVLRAPTWASVPPSSRVLTPSPAARSVDRSAAAATAPASRRSRLQVACAVDIAPGTYARGPQADQVICACCASAMPRLT
jgi:hypothetical protein